MGSLREQEETRAQHPGFRPAAMGYAWGRVSALAFLSCHLGHIIPVNPRSAESYELHLWMQRVGTGVLRNDKEIRVKAKQSDKSEEAPAVSPFKSQDKSEGWN